VSILIANLKAPPNHRYRVLKVRYQVVVRKMWLAEGLSSINALGLTPSEYMGFKTTFKFPPHAIWTQFIKSISRLEYPSNSLPTAAPSAVNL
jgi:hypothetical protein